MLKIKGHIPSLDGLRGLAILLVMIHHFTVIEPVSSFGKGFVKLTHMGGYGVDLFFVLSGFLITGILLDTKDSPHYFKNFYMRRILRIFPLYYFFIALCLLLIPKLLTYVPAAGEQLTDFLEARKNWYWYAFYISNFWIAIKDHFSRGGLDITWSLAIEEHFYLVWPWLICWLNRIHIPKVCLYIVSLAFLIRCAMWFFGASPLQIYVLTFSRMDTIALGAFIAAYARLADSKQRLLSVWGHPLAITFMSIFLGILFLNGLLENESPFLNTTGYTLIAFLFAQTLILLLTAGPSSPVNRIFTHPILIFLGKYSYAIYFFHIPLAAAIRDLFFGPRQFEVLPGPAMLWQIVFYLVATAAVIPPALLSWNLLEKQTLKLKNLFPMETSGGGK